MTSPPPPHPTQILSPGTTFTGNTNTGTNAVIHDISSIMRPNLRMSQSPTHMARTDREKRRRQAKGMPVTGEGSPAQPSGQAVRFDVQNGMWTDEQGLPANAPHQAAPPDAANMDTAEQLRHIFRYYCAFGRTGGKGAAQDTVDSSNFMKFARECPGLITRKLNRTEIDLIFTKAKPKFERRLDFTHFLDALSALAAKRYPRYDPTTAFSVLLAHHVFKVPCAPQASKEQAQSRPNRSAPGTPGAGGAAGSGDMYSQHEQGYNERTQEVADRQRTALEERELARQRQAALNYSPGNATIAGSGNKVGGVYDRLSSPQTFTGVYRRRFEGDGRINAHTDLTASATQFGGSTNTNTNETFHDIKGMLRTNLRSGGSRMMRFEPGAGRRVMPRPSQVSAHLYKSSLSSVSFRPPPPHVPPLPPPRSPAKSIWDPIYLLVQCTVPFSSRSIVSTPI